MDREKMLRKFLPRMEAIVYIDDGRVDRVETPDGFEIAECDRSPKLRAVVDAFGDSSSKGKSRVFVYKDGGIGVSVDS